MHYLSRQKELDANLKAIQQIKFGGQLKKTRLNFSQGSKKVLWKMESYEETRFKLTNTQLNKLKSTAKNKTGTTLIITKKNFQDERQPHELFLTTR